MTGPTAGALRARPTSACGVDTQAGNVGSSRPTVSSATRSSGGIRDLTRAPRSETVFAQGAADYNRSDWRVKPTRGGWVLGISRPREWASPLLYLHWPGFCASLR